MRTINNSDCKYLTTLGKQLIFSVFVLFIYQMPALSGQGAFKLGVGIHGSDYKSIDLDDFSLDNKSINYHATLGYRIDVPFLFAEANLGLDVDRYVIDSKNVEQFKVIMPLVAGVKLFMFDIKTGVMGRIDLNKNSVVNQIKEIDQVTFQYLTGVNVRFEKISLGIDYLSSNSFLVEKVINQELTIDNEIRNRLFVTLYYKF